MPKRIRAPTDWTRLLPGSLQPFVETHDVERVAAHTALLLRHGMVCCQNAVANRAWLTSRKTLIQIILPQLDRITDAATVLTGKDRRCHSHREPTPVALAHT